jgi:hypothetical protein
MTRVSGHRVGRDVWFGSVFAWPGTAGHVIRPRTCGAAPPNPLCEAGRCLLSAEQPLLQTVLEHGADNIL